MTVVCLVGLLGPAGAPAGAPEPATEAREAGADVLDLLLVWGSNAGSDDPNTA